MNEEEKQKTVRQVADAVSKELADREEAVNQALFRPSSMLRRRLCPGSLALESTLTPVEDPTEYQAEGKLLHELTANPLLSRASILPAQLDLIETVEKAEREFLEKIL